MVWAEYSLFEALDRLVFEIRTVVTSAAMNIQAG